MPDTHASTPDWPLPFWIAHRGAGRLAPENTLCAFRQGAELGWRGFECDVQLSSDGVPFLLHDARLERTTNGRGVGSATPWSTLTTLDAGAWHGPATLGEPVCSLAALAAAAAEGEWALNLELKPSPGQAQRLGHGVALWLRQHWRGARPPVLSSFEPESLRAVRQADEPRPTGSPWPLALLLERWRPDAPQLALGLSAQAVVCHHRSLDAQAIRNLHAAGLRALAYTVNTHEEAARLRAAGVDGLITDAVTAFRPDVAPAQRRGHGV
ncbi:MAG: glycerophosphodiester phosphodiesterase family protein [Inhella sp.]|uniref:glycerophosphodiester phosphodiesterase family protein n=1 Tax=Inhella sp. TaxID=1921806 RepID=UPI0022BDEDB5|nr:glycerophosphodiester phosphodiesterase family protein [Inhella sp.]MCZ8236676.1 glycerophosphodiester phosphodiesterase family protein [Inhella sp.]